MLRAYCLLAPIVLAPISGCVTRTYSSDPPPPPGYVQPATSSDTKPPACLPLAGPQVAAPVAFATAAPAAPPSASLVVANVHKEAVSIYTVRGDQLGFIAQVPPGEAIDLPVTAGARLAATFSRAPNCVNYAAKGQAGEVWLLRPAGLAPAGPCNGGCPPCQPVPPAQVPVVAQ